GLGGRGTGEGLGGGVGGVQGGLKDTGFVEGENVSIVYRWAENQSDRLPELAEELVRRRVAVIAANSTAALPAKAATTTIPIVFLVAEDPVRTGLVASLARPGNNLTGINRVSGELTAKRLELLLGLVPAVARVAVLVNPAGPSTETQLRDVEPAARGMGLQINVLNASTSREIDAAFATFVDRRPDALFVAADIVFTSRRVQLANLAARHGIPMTSATRDVAIIYRWAENQLDRLPELAADLVRRQVAVITPVGASSIFAAKAATTTIPIVFITGDDPVGIGLVASIARPGGNLTGIGIFTTELAAKRLELLRELLPTAARIAVLINPASAATTEATLREVEPAARAMGLRIEIFNANTSREIDTAFESMLRERPDALFVASTPFLNARVVQLTQLATFHRLPAIYGLREHAEVGGLISYGSNIGDAFRQAGLY